MAINREREIGEILLRGSFYVEVVQDLDLKKIIHIEAKNGLLALTFEDLKDISQWLTGEMEISSIGLTFKPKYSHQEFVNIGRGVADSTLVVEEKFLGIPKRSKILIEYLSGPI